MAKLKTKSQTKGWEENMKMTTKQKFYSYIEELCAYAIADCEVNDKKADEFWGWFKLKMEEAYKRGREDEAIECQKDMERVVEEKEKEINKAYEIKCR